MKTRSTLLALACATSVLFAGFGLAQVAGAASMHDAARQVDGYPNTFYWAVIIGVSDYAGRTQDLPGSANDARALRDHLRRLGWRDDHIYMLTDRSATRDAILRSIRWLASKTNHRSAAIFHYSGHEQPNYRDPDRDRERVDPQIRAHDNRYIIDSQLGNELGRVRAARFWIDLSLCRAGGFDDRGIRGTNRVVTYSSPVNELSYEDRGLRHSVFSYFQIKQGLLNRQADWNHDGKITVEEAFWYSRMPVRHFTREKQHPFIWDGLSGDFSITPPAPTQQRPPSTPTPSPSTSPAPSPSPSPAPSPSASPTPTSSPTPTASPSPSPTSSPTPTSSPSPSPSPSSSPTPTSSPSPTESPTPTSSPSPTPSSTCVPATGVCV